MRPRMARRFLPFICIAMILAGAVGCQPQSMVQNLPAPSFNGPTISPVAAAPILPPPSLIQPKLPARTALTGDRAWAPPVAPRAWKWIVIHHSASPSGSAAVFDREHRERGFDELGYDFVI